MGKIMDENKKLTDEERIELTKKAYDELELGETVEINGKFIGIVSDTTYAADGMRAFVITNANEVTILFKGSYGISRGNPTTWRDEWLKTNLPILLAMLTSEKKIPSQLKTASYFLNKSIHQFKGAHFYIYGHSLGAINAQYALANCRHPEEIMGAYLYEGTNIWTLLNQKQRQRVSKMRNKIYNYVDIYDPVTLGITATHHMVGKLQYVKSEQMQPIKQHMWGGYQFDQKGKLQLSEVDDKFLQMSQNERKLLLQSSDLANKLGQNVQEGELRNLVLTKLNEMRQKYPGHHGLVKLVELVNKISDHNQDKGAGS